jgi:hypothetical protein
MASMDQFMHAVQERVCANCIDSDGYGTCRLSASQQCAVTLYLPKIVETVLSVQSERMDPYVQELRRVVCGQCTHQSADGKCSLRTELECGLDRYFPLVVEAIEEVKNERR